MPAILPALFLCAAPVAVDGDTLRCRNHGLVRLARIDAPELPGHCRAGRNCAPGDPLRARATLARMLKGTVRCRPVDADPRTRRIEPRDRWGRIVARCRARGRDLGEAMVRAGLARRWP